MVSRVDSQLWTSLCCYRCGNATVAQTLLELGASAKASGKWEGMYILTTNNKHATITNAIRHTKPHTYTSRSYRQTLYSNGNCKAHGQTQGVRNTKTVNNTTQHCTHQLLPFLSLVLYQQHFVFLNNIYLSLCLSSDVRFVV